MDDRTTHGAAWLWRLVAIVASSVLLTVMQAPYNAHYLAWAAWVPFVLACSPAGRRRGLLLSAYAVAFVHWLFNLSWLWQVTEAGYIVFALYLSLYWPAVALAVRFVRTRQWPLTLCVPAIVVGAEAVQGVLFGGFNWFFLSHSQYRQIELIQLCDIFGASGVSVLVALVNGLTADGVLEYFRQRRLGWSFAKKAMLTMACLWAAAGYGFYRLHQSPDFVTDGPVVGSVQPNVPSHVKEEIENAQEILDAMIVDSRACIDAGAALVAWPETMVLATMNPGYLMYCNPDSQPLRFSRQILDHAAGGAYILFGAHAAKVDGNLAITDQFNSAYLYRPDGMPDLRRYDKIHLVPFGEYIPFHKTAPRLYRWILSLSPYDYDYNLTAGDDFTNFDIDVEGRNWRFGVLICYEDTHPTVTRRMVVADDGQKRAHWLVNLSNDGWYVRFADGKVIPSAELAQRTAISVFRCVENRIAIVRSVNTGISCLIDSTGRIRDGFLAGSLPKAAMDRQGVSGWFTDRVPVDSRVTVFSRFGRRLDALLGAAFVWLLLRATVERFWKRAKQRDVQ